MCDKTTFTKIGVQLSVSDVCVCVCGVCGVYGVRGCGVRRVYGLRVRVGVGGSRGRG